MSPGEVSWRLRGTVRALADRCLAPTRRRSMARAPLSQSESSSNRSRAARVLPERMNIAVGAGFPREEQRNCLVSQARDIEGDRLEFFTVDTGDVVGETLWNYEYEARRPTPMTFAAGIDYRDHAITGDAKVVWEPNRHQHLAVLARAYHLTGDSRYARKVVTQIDSWIDQCPYAKGMNWRSPMELSIRLINWVWSLAMIEASDAVSPEQWQRILGAAHRHMWDVSRNYSRYSSANNHVIGEAAGVFIGSIFFDALRPARRWRTEAKLILEKQIRAQTLADGGHCELAPAYHLFVLELLLVAGLAGRNTGCDFSPGYWERIEAMCAFVAGMLEGGDCIPQLGDSDDGYVLDLETDGDRARNLLAVGAALFGRSDFKELAEDAHERVYWLLGNDGCRAFDGLESLDRKEGALAIRSRAFPESGYYLLQCGSRSPDDDRISVSFDCGALGFGSIAAHGHADALSLTVRISGVDVLIDPGTYDYFTFPEWRRYFRSTPAHNTITVDGLDQSENRGSFIWGKRAAARCLRWDPSDEGGWVSGEHDGYTRLDDRVMHRRTVSLDASRREIVVHDELTGDATHGASVFFHFAEHCRVEQDGPARLRVDYGKGVLAVQTDRKLKIEIHRGGTDPIIGWTSRGYHSKEASTSVEGRCRWSGHVSMTTRMSIASLD